VVDDMVCWSLLIKMSYANGHPSFTLLDLWPYHLCNRLLLSGHLDKGQGQLFILC
jgi:hypothetical protein